VNSISRDGKIMGLPGVEGAAAEVREALASGDGERIASASTDFLVQFGSGESISPREYKILSDLLASPEVVRSDQSHTLFDLVQHFWPDFGREQEIHMIGLLEDLYPGLEDWVAQLSITDALAECPSSEAGLAALRRLKRVAGDVPRALVANGLAQLAKHSRVPDAGRLALQELLDMRADPSARVRDEVRDLLGAVVTTVSGEPDHPLRSDLIREGLLNAME